MSAPPALGSLFARRYRIGEVLGHGGMGVVVAARDERTSVRCAIKLLDRNADVTDTARLVREARALMLLTSPHVVRIFDVGADASAGAYLVLERLAGCDLAKLSPRGRRMPPPVVAALALQACEALAQAHAIGIIHRDIKPSNLFLTSDADGRSVLKVLDFGVSKLTTVTGRDKQSTLTHGDGALGSPQYISPEQLRDPHSVDARTDLWSMGVVLFRLLTGAFPFDGKTVAETFAAILGAPIPTLAQAGADSPPGLQAVLDRCLCRDLAQRVTSARDLADLLRPFADPDPRSAACDGDMLFVATTTPAHDIEPSTQPMTGRARPRAGARRVVTVAATMVLALGGASLVYARVPRAVARQEVVVATPVTPVTPIAAPPAAASVSGVELAVRADAPILGLRVPGVRRLEVNGASATMVVAPWSGVLEIYADLEGGGRARGEAHADGAASVALVTVASAQRRSPNKAAAPLVRPASPAETAPPPPSTGTLRSNPYL